MVQPETFWKPKPVVRPADSSDQGSPGHAKAAFSDQTPGVIQGKPGDARWHGRESPSSLDTTFLPLRGHQQAHLSLDGNDFNDLDIQESYDRGEQSRSYDRYEDEMEPSPPSRKRSRASSSDAESVSAPPRKKVVQNPECSSS